MKAHISLWLTGKITSLYPRVKVEQRLEDESFVAGDSCNEHAARRRQHSWAENGRSSIQVNDGVSPSEAG